MANDPKKAQTTGTAAAAAKQRELQLKQEKEVLDLQEQRTALMDKETLVRRRDIVELKRHIRTLEQRADIETELASAREELLFGRTKDFQQQQATARKASKLRLQAKNEARDFKGEFVESILEPFKVVKDAIPAPVQILGEWATTKFKKALGFGAKGSTKPIENQEVKKVTTDQLVVSGDVISDKEQPKRQQAELEEKREKKWHKEDVAVEKKQNKLLMGIKASFAALASKFGLGGRGGSGTDPGGSGERGVVDKVVDVATNPRSWFEFFGLKKAFDWITGRGEKKGPPSIKRPAGFVPDAKPKPSVAKKVLEKVPGILKKVTPLLSKIAPALNGVSKAVGGVFGVLAAPVIGALQGAYQAGEVFDKKDKDVTMKDRFLAGIGGAVDWATLGLVERKDVAKGLSGDIPQMRDRYGLTAREDVQLGPGGGVPGTGITDYVMPMGEKQRMEHLRDQPKKAKPIVSAIDKQIAKQEKAAALMAEVSVLTKLQAERARIKTETIDAAMIAGSSASEIDMMVAAFEGQRESKLANLDKQIAEQEKVISAAESTDDSVQKGLGVKSGAKSPPFLSWMPDIAVNIQKIADLFGISSASLGGHLKLSAPSTGSPETSRVAAPSTGAAPTKVSPPKSTVGDHFKQPSNSAAMTSLLDTIAGGESNSDNPYSMVNLPQMGKFSRSLVGGGRSKETGMASKGDTQFKGLGTHNTRDTSLSAGQDGYWQQAGGKDITQMTVDEVIAAQDKGMMFAAGRYQVIPSTLKMAKKNMGLKGSEKFDKDTQDQIGSWLVTGKAGGGVVGKFLRGEATLDEAATAMSKEWASISTEEGKMTSYYKGEHNKAHTSRELIMEQLKSLKAGRPTTDDILSGVGASPYVPTPIQPRLGATLLEGGSALSRAQASGPPVIISPTTNIANTGGGQPAQIPKTRIIRSSKSAGNNTIVGQGTM